MGKIYIITKKINDKIYVGKTERTIKQRWGEHLYARTQPDKKHYKLYAAMNKYGVENFSIGELEDCPTSLLNDREIYWINRLDSYNNGYNMTLGGDGTSSILEEQMLELWDQGLGVTEIAQKLGCHKATVGRRLQSYANYSTELANERGRKLTNAAKQKECYTYDSNGNIVESFHDVSSIADKLGFRIERIRIWCKNNLVREGKLYSYRILTQKEVLDCFLHQGQCKAVEQFDLSGRHINTFPSIRAAMESTGVNNISQAASGKLKTSGGFVWRYLDDTTNKSEERHTIRGRKKVAQYSLDDKLIKIYDSITDAAKSTNQKTSSNITQVCKGKAKTAGGYKWRYYEESNE